MPKLSLPQIRAMLDDAKAAYKAKFTPGFYHGSPSNDIKAFDSSKATKDFPIPGATFVTKNPNFAESFLPTVPGAGNVYGVGSKKPKDYDFAHETGSTMYPVSVNLGKHFDPSSIDSHDAIKSFIDKKHPNLTKEQYEYTINNLKYRLSDPVNNWGVIEHPEFLQHLRDTGHNSFAVTEGGTKNVGVFEPENIRGKFAEFNPDEAMNPDFMKAQGGLIHMAGGGKIPEAVVKAYKLFRTKANKPDELYPLFVNTNKPVPIGEWTNAEVGPVAASGKVKSKLGELAYRPGWHAGDLPIATHIGGKSDPKLKAPDFRRPDEVWAEVEMPNDVDWQTIANQRAELNKAGAPIARTAHITDQLPEGGHYRYKTSPNMEGNWLIGGGMKVNKVLTDEEVQAINSAAGKADLPRFTQFDKPMGTPEEGMAIGGGVIKKALEHARSVPFVHYSHSPSIARLEPSAYGTGIKGAEAARLKGAEDIRPRSFFYPDTPNVRPEAGLGPHKYSGVSESSYPLHEDPADYRLLARAKAKDPYLASVGVDQINPDLYHNELERQIKNAGYTGYHTDDAGLLFHPTDVQKVTD